MSRKTTWSTSGFRNLLIWDHPPACLEEITSFITKSTWFVQTLPLPSVLNSPFLEFRLILASVSASHPVHIKNPPCVQTTIKNPSPPISFLCTNFKSSPRVQTKWFPPGPPGTGKSTMASLISERENRVFYEGISWQTLKRKHWKVRKVMDFSLASTPTSPQARTRQVHNGDHDLDERFHQDVCNNQTFGFISCMWGEMSKWEASADWTWYERATEGDVWLLWVRFLPLAGTSTYIQGDFFNSSCTA